MSIGCSQTPFEFLGARAMNQDSPGAGAALTGSSHRAEYDRGHRQVQVGNFIDDQCVVAAEFEQAFPQALGDAHADLSANVRRAGEGDQRHSTVIDKSAGEFRTCVDEDLKYGGEPMTFQHSIANVLHRQSAQRGLGRRLPNGGIAGNGRQECVPGPYGHRKIKCRNDAHDAERMPLFVHAVLRALRVHGVAVQHARLTDREVGNIDHLLDFAVAFSLDLAVLQRHQTAERIFVRAKLLADQPHRLAAFRRRHAPPRSRRGHRCRHDNFVIRSRRAAHLRQPLAGRRIDRVDQRTAGVGAPAVASRPCAGVDVLESQGLEWIVAVLHKGRFSMGRRSMVKGPHFDLAQRTTLASLRCRPHLP
ncbi:MAG TPA: hypothetical protein VK495_02040 [Steroidobacteraceae bacterium]|nr:hypothetical protein [Steroidobacteraceae bacterium]